MDLAEIQNIWSEMSVELDKQKKLTNEIILKMTQQEYKARMNKIKIPEILGGIVCLGAALLILFHFSELDTWPLRVCGVISLLVIIILPIFSIKAIKQMDSVDLTNKNYKQTLLSFAKGKRQFFKVQKLSLYLGFVLLLTTSVVFSKLMGGDDILTMDKVGKMLRVLPFGILFFVLFTRWVVKSNKKKMNNISQLLENIEQTD